MHDFGDVADFIGWYGDAAHRRAGIAKNDAGALWDDGLRIGVCGDWLSGPRGENAFLSGLALARRIAG